MRKYIYSVIVLIVMPVMAGAAEKDTLITFDGTLKTKFEVSTADDNMRFDVRNSRVGARGMYNNFFGYRLQVELNNEGVFSVLDAYGILQAGKFSINMGQVRVPFENSYIITPAEMLFANRAFIGKYFTPGSRDLGATVQYNFSLGRLPLSVSGGLFNGGKINNPVWNKVPSLAAQLTAGSLSRWKAAVKVYRYDADTSRIFFSGADVSYRRNNLLLQAEVMDSYNIDSKKTFSGAYVQGAYTIPLTICKNIKYLRPALRWDAMGYEFSDNGVDIHRATIGFDIGFSDKPVSSLLRFNFEQYFVRGNASDFPDIMTKGGKHALDHKFTVELLIVF